MPTRDIPFDEECPDAPVHVRDNFADLRPLAEVEAMRRKWADNLDRARERMMEHKCRCDEMSPYACECCQSVLDDFCKRLGAEYGK